MTLRYVFSDLRDAALLEMAPTQERAEALPVVAGNGKSMADMSDADLVDGVSR
jgi:hypothetical protein